MYTLPETVKKSFGAPFSKGARTPKALKICTFFRLLTNTQCALRGVNCGTIRGIVPQERGALQERAPLWNPLPKSTLFGLEQYFGSPNGDNENWNAFLVVKKCEYRVPVQMKGFAPSIPTSPFLKGLIPKSIDRFSNGLRTNAGV